MKKIILIYIPIICIALVALYKLYSQEVDLPNGKVQPQDYISDSTSSVESEELNVVNPVVLTKIEGANQSETDELERLKQELQNAKEEVSSLKILNGELASEASNRSNSNEVDKGEHKIFSFSDVENKPIFPGCEGFLTEPAKAVCFNQKIQEHIREKFEIPELARQMGIEGKVYVTFVIEKNGKVSSISITKSVHKLIDDEAIRVINELPTFIPAKRSGKIVRMQYTIPINAVHTSQKSTYQDIPNRYERHGYVTGKRIVRLYSTPYVSGNENKLPRIDSHDSVYIIDSKSYGNFVLVWTKGKIGYVKQRDLL